MKYLVMSGLFLIIISCQNDTRYLIAKNQLGYLNKDSKIHQINSLLPNDSVVIVNARNPFGSSLISVAKEIKVYDSSNLQILTIKPFGSMDTLSNIRSIRILSEKFKTKNDIGLGSTFKELKKHHDVSNIQSLANSIIINIEDIKAFVSFDRKVLPGEVRFDMDVEVKPTMIPDDAKINRFWVNFSEEVDEKK